MTFSVYECKKSAFNILSFSAYFFHKKKNKNNNKMVKSRMGSHVT